MVSLYIHVYFLLLLLHFSTSNGNCEEDFSDIFQDPNTDFAGEHRREDED